MEKKTRSAYIEAVSQGDKKDIDILDIFIEYGGKEISQFYRIILPKN